jgi:hypothetical protein
MCFCCAVLCSRLGTLSRVVPVGVCAVPSPFHSLLRGYKDHPDPRRRRWCTERLGCLLAGFLSAHGPCLAAVTGVPLERAVLVSPGHPRPNVPMAAVLRSESMARAAHDAHARGVPLLPPVVPALEPAAGHQPPAHLRADPKAFEIDRAHHDDIAGRSVLLLDDTLTTGAAAQSAAAALRKAGAASVVVVVLGRVVRPKASRAQRRYWEVVRAASSAAGSS